MTGLTIEQVRSGPMKGVWFIRRGDAYTARRPLAPGYILRAWE